SESSGQPASASLVRGDARVPGSAAPGVGRDRAVEAERQSPCKGTSNWSGLQRQRSPCKRRHANPPRGGPRESRARQAEAKATEGTCACPPVNDVGEPCAGEPHARFEGGQRMTHWRRLGSTR